MDIEKDFKIAKKPLNSKFELAKEISLASGGKLSIGLILGIVKRIGERATFMIYDELRKQGNLQPALFLWKVKQEKIVDILDI